MAQGTRVATGTATLQVKANKVTLVAAVCNNPGSTATLAIYDASAGTTTQQKAAIGAPVGGGRYEYGILMQNGIYVVNGGGTPGDWTIIWE